MPGMLQEKNMMYSIYCHVELSQMYVILYFALMWLPEMHCYFHKM